MRSASIALESLSVLISAVLLYALLVHRTNRSRLELLFRNMVGVNLAALLADLVLLVCRGERFTLLLKLAAVLSFSGGYALEACFCAFLFTYIDPERGRAHPIQKLLELLCMLAVVPVLLSLWTHWYFMVEGGIYMRGAFFVLSQIASSLLLAAAVLIVLINLRRLNATEVRSLLGYSALPALGAVLRLLVPGLSLMYVSTTLCAMVAYMVLEREHQHELEQDRVQLMLSQIQPHFLYNTLSSIAMLCTVDPGKAQEVTVAFSDYLRGNLCSLNDRKPIPFGKELEHTKLYVGIEQVRFGDALRMEYDITAHRFALPALTLQPLVENAIRHGVTKKKGGGTVSVSTREDAQYFYVEVRDDGLGFDPAALSEGSGEHVGLRAVRMRLREISGGTLSIESSPGAGTRVEVRIPK